MKYFQKRYCSIAVSMALAAVGTANTAVAAELEEIVVTAEFRENNVQDTPLAITAMSTEMLDARGITDVAAIGRIAPNVNISGTAAIHGPAAAVYIRGVGQFDSNMAFEPGVGMYVDDIYQGTMTGSMMSLLDLERVEVLRGPQGTLAGKNSIGGSVKLFTLKPEGDNTGYAEFTIGEGGKRIIRAAYDLPLIEDKLFMRVSGMSKEQDGHVTRLDYACANPGVTVTPQFGAPFIPTRASVRPDCKIGTMGATDTAGFRAALRWLASDDIEVNLTAGVIEDNSEMGGMTQILNNFNPGVVSPDPYTNYANFIHPVTNEVFPNVGAVDSKDFGLTVDWAINDSMSLKSITGFRDLLAEYSNDQDGDPYGTRLNYNEQDYQQFTQELRLSGVSANDSIDWTVGLYYFDSDGVLANRISSSAAFDFFNDDNVISTSKSVFGHVIWHANDKMNLTAGIRYTDDKKTYFFHQVAADGVTPTAQDGLVASYTGDNTDVRLGIDYQVNEDMMAYAQFSTGYKGGGTNPRPVGLGQALPFEPEYLDAYEIGLKSDLLDGAMRLNLSAFFNKYSDIILTNSAACCGPVGSPTWAPFAILPFNAGDADIKGFEAELEWAPGENLLINASFSKLDFEFTRIASSDIITINLPDGATTPYTAEVQWSLGAAYTFNLAGGSTITPRIDITYQDEIYTDPSNSPLTLLDDFTLANARVNWTSADESWQATLAVDNLTDEVYYPSSFDATTFSGTLQAGVGRPREVSFTIRRNF